MIESLQSFTTSLPPMLQWLGVLLVAAIPFVESYFGAVLGVVSGMNPVVAIAAAVVGNILSLLIFVIAAHRVRVKVSAGKAPKEMTPRRAKLRAAFDKFGVAGVSLIGPTILPSQITSVAMISFGASKNAVILWQVISIIIWGTAFGVLATMGISLAR
ncbi:hypothetical protein SAMN04489740_3000 [Arthrobacter alpinus]|uniref:Uncharacterized protein n=1 Tax=Arthrobacter alpinus TaxID=656366 RepID=A0A0U3QJV1_9MICC|nr:hypothetical protein [Arthrobacter alpinus]ALV46958.1 hypothetical protein MB46_17195 [Arthrobacter alpinus]SEE89913.1 hypothetical protein SAMN04489740_3000 [Arthrobacter alpinus]